MSGLKQWIELILSLVFTALGEVMAWLNLEWLQKMYYLLAGALMAVAIWKVLTGKNLNVEKLSRPGAIVDQAKDPKKKGEAIVILAYKIGMKIENILTRGGMKMREFVKNRSWIQWISFGATALLLALGILSAFVPELAVIGTNIEAYLIALGFVATPGILSKGKVVGDAVKTLLPAKERRQIERQIRAFTKKLDELTKKYKEVIEIARDVKELGGTLTPEQQTQYNTYVTQKNALEGKINAELKKMEVAKSE